MDSEKLDQIDSIILQAIDDGVIPGCVVLIGRKGHIVKHTAYGHRMLNPSLLKAELDTIYDLASLTKPVATATSIMILTERGLIRLDDRVEKFIPQFQGGEKDEVRIHHLLTHTSGLISFRDYRTMLRGAENRRQAVIESICEESLRYSPGKDFNYSDLNYILLEEIIFRLTDQRIPEFAAENIFNPLGMRDTMYDIPRDLKDRCAANIRGADIVIYGDVHDPTADFLGGISGNAGLFSTAKDLSIYLEMLLNKGAFLNTRILSPASVATMTANHIAVENQRRSYGWDIETGYSYPKGDLTSDRSFGHTGYTGTSIWVDPEYDLFILFLSNRMLAPRMNHHKPVIRALSNIALGSLIYK